MHQTWRAILMPAIGCLITAIGGCRDASLHPNVSPAPAAHTMSVPVAAKPASDVASVMQPAPAKGLFLRRNGPQLWLFDNGARLLVNNPNFSDPFTAHIEISGGSEVVLPLGAATYSSDQQSIIVRRNGKEVSRLDEDNLFHQWLKQVPSAKSFDEAWNTTSTQDGAQPGMERDLSASFTGACLLGKSLFAVLNWYFPWDSAPQPEASYLVKVQTVPPITVTFIRSVAAFSLDKPQLFAVNDRLMLINGTRLQEIRPDGQVVRTDAHWPAPYSPEGVLGAHWLILTANVDPDNTGVTRRTSLRYSDIRTGAVRALGRAWLDEDSVGGIQVVVPRDGHSIVAMRRVPIGTVNTVNNDHSGSAPDCERFWTVAVPSGRGIEMESPAQPDLPAPQIVDVWHNMVILNETRQVTVGPYRPPATRPPISTRVPGLVNDPTSNGNLAQVYNQPVVCCYSVATGRLLKCLPAPQTN